MVKLLIGHKGSGKTKRMIELANETVQTARGSIVFINKNSRLKGPFDITNAHRKKIMRVCDVCIRDTPKGLAFLLICSEINTWSSCRCIGITKGSIRSEGNTLLFSFEIGDAI